MQFFPAAAQLRRDLFGYVDARIHGKNSFWTVKSSSCYLQNTCKYRVCFWGLGHTLYPSCETCCFACLLRNEIRLHDLSENTCKKVVAVILQSVTLIPDTAVPWCASNARS